MINAGTSSQEMVISHGAYDIETVIAMLNASNALFELVSSGESAFKIIVTNFYMIDFTNVPEIQLILGFESSVLVKKTGQPTTILPEYVVQPNSGDERYHFSYAIDTSGY